MIVDGVVMYWPKRLTDVMFLLWILITLHWCYQFRFNLEGLRMASSAMEGSLHPVLHCCRKGSDGDVYRDSWRSVVLVTGGTSNFSSLRMPSTENM